jgi:predicted  nucleic acid-binding Zn-ribbon protein
MWVFEWTGEQFLPATRDASLVYRQVHSYLFAAQFVKGRSVLDVRAGDGSGAETLAQTAASVVAIVADERLAAQANEKHKKPNLRFTTVAESGPFDVILCFEAPADADLKRFLNPGGLLITSAKTHETLRDRLNATFRHVQLFGQSDQTGSCIWPLDTPPATYEFKTLQSQPRTPSCVIALASDVVYAPPQNLNVLIDEANGLLKDRNQRIQELLQNEACQRTALGQHETQLADRRESLAHLQKAVAWHETQIASLIETRDFMGREVSHYRNAFESSEKAVGWRTRQVEELQDVRKVLQAGIDHLHTSIEHLQSKIRSLEEGLAWRETQVEEFTAALAARAAEVEELNATVRNLESERLRLTALAHELEAIRASRGWQWILRLRR